MVPRLSTWNAPQPLEGGSPFELIWLDDTRIVARLLTSTF